MSYFPNPTAGGVGGMFEYENAVSMGIDQVNTYHPLWTAGMVAGTLDGWTFTAGLDGSFTAVASIGGGQIRVTTSAPHGMVAGEIVALTSASVAGYRPPNPTIFVIQAVAATTFDVVATFTATATGTWTRGAYLKAGTAAAGKYELFWNATAKTSAGANKTYKFEPCQNITNIDKAASGAIIDATGAGRIRRVGLRHHRRWRHHHPTMSEPDRRDGRDHYQHEPAVETIRLIIPLTPLTCLV
jgi:hypothetical protein